LSLTGLKRESNTLTDTTDHSQQININAPPIADLHTAGLQNLFAA
jgi:hypothetical protein